MKKLLLMKLMMALLAVALLLTACGGTPNAGGAATTAAATTAAATAAAAETTAAAGDAKETEAAATTAAATTAKAAETTAAAATGDAPMEFTVALQRGHIESDSRIQKYMEEKFNVKINLIIIPSGADAQAKINLLMADESQRPDVIWWTTGNMAKEYNQWRDAGLLVDVSEYYWKYPYIREYYEKVSPDSMFYIAEPDGSLYALPGDVGEPGHMINLMRKDWLDYVGLGVPKTFDEYVDALRKMQESNPGKGASGYYAFAGMGMELRSLKPFWSYFNCIPDNFIFLDDGSVGYGAIQPEVKEALAFIQGLYNEGMIDPNIVVRDLNFTESFVAGTFGSSYRWIAWMNPEDNSVKAFKANNPNGEYISLEPFPNGHGTESDNSISAAAWCAFSITDKAKDPEGIYRFFDYLAGPEDYLIRRYGFEGEHYSLENGVFKSLMTEDENAAQNVGRNLFDTFVNRKDEYNITNTPEVVRMFARGTELVQPDIKRICYVKTTERPVWNENRAELERLRDEYIWGIVAGQRPLEDFDVFVELFKNNGGEAAERETAQLMAQQVLDYAQFQESFRAK